jgi:hypothetical protein
MAENQNIATTTSSLFPVSQHKHSPRITQRSTVLTGNTFSARLSEDSSPETMILSALPEGLQRLADCGARLPHMTFTVDELDGIIEGRDTEALESSCADGCYLDAVLPTIDWWLDVASDMVGGNGMEHDFSMPGYEDQKQNLTTLLHDVLSSYAAAVAESGLSFSASDRIPAGMEMLKRYRLFTRYVCSFAQEVWPGVDLGWLLKQA